MEAKVDEQDPLEVKVCEVEAAVRPQAQLVHQLARLGYPQAQAQAQQQAVVQFPPQDEKLEHLERPKEVYGSAQGQRAQRAK